MQGHIEIVKSRAANLYTPAAWKGRLQYHVRIKSSNGKILASSETYTRERAAKKCALAIGNIKRIYTVDETGD